jgi:hypothetical protein
VVRAKLVSEEWPAAIVNTLGHRFQCLDDHGIKNSRSGGVVLCHLLTMPYLLNMSHFLDKEGVICDVCVSVANRDRKDHRLTQSAKFSDWIYRMIGQHLRQSLRTKEAEWKRTVGSQFPISVYFANSAN